MIHYLDWARFFFFRLFCLGLPILVFLTLSYQNANTSLKSELDAAQHLLQAHPQKQFALNQLKVRLAQYKPKEPPAPSTFEEFLISQKILSPRELPHDAQNTQNSPAIETSPATTIP